MKHIRGINESYTIQSIKNILDIYNQFLTDIKPAVIKEYIKLANDKHYYPDQGEKPYQMKNPNQELNITECYSNNVGFLFILTEYNNDGESVAHYYIQFENEEMEEALLELTAKKYNV